MKVWNPLGVFVLVALAAIWELLVRFSIAEVQFLPAPSEIAVAAQDELFGGELIGRLIHTLGVTALGWTIASLIGVGFGLLLGLWPTAYRYSMTSFEVTRAIPPITFVPAALLIFGFSLKMGTCTRDLRRALAGAHQHDRRGPVDSARTA